jgi:hypothetical protein
VYPVSKNYDISNFLYYYPIKEFLKICKYSLVYRSIKEEPKRDSIKGIGLWAECQRLTPVILATWETEIRRISIQDQPRQQKLDPISKIPNLKRTGRAPA